MMHKKLLCPAIQYDSVVHRVGYG